MLSDDAPNKAQKRVNNNACYDLFQEILIKYIEYYDMVVLTIFNKYNT
jgi:hypothetical protein